MHLEGPWATVWDLMLIDQFLMLDTLLSPHGAQVCGSAGPSRAAAEMVQEEGCSSAKDHQRWRSCPDPHSSDQGRLKHKCACKGDDSCAVEHRSLNRGHYSIKDTACCNSLLIFIPTLNEGHFSKDRQLGPCGVCYRCSIIHHQLIILSLSALRF